jgi:hypothetical protein
MALLWWLMLTHSNLLRVECSGAYNRTLTFQSEQRNYWRYLKFMSIYECEQNETPLLLVGRSR